MKWTERARFIQDGSDKLSACVRVLVWMRSMRSRSGEDFAMKWTAFVTIFKQTYCLHSAEKGGSGERRSDAVKDKKRTR